MPQASAGIPLSSKRPEAMDCVKEIPPLFILGEAKEHFLRGIYPNVPRYPARGD